MSLPFAMLLCLNLNSKQERNQTILSQTIATTNSEYFRLLLRSSYQFTHKALIIIDSQALFFEIKEPLTKSSPPYTVKENFKSIHPPLPPPPTKKTVRKSPIVDDREWNLYKVVLCFGLLIHTEEKRSLFICLSLYNAPLFEH